MGLHYEAEYRIGRRGGRVCRSYAGFRAFLAILFDLIFGLFFDVFDAVFALVMRSPFLSIQCSVAVLKFSWRLMVFMMTTLVQILALPHKLIQDRSKSANWGHWSDAFFMPRGRAAKPDWGLGREV